jgi:hypothetical protein
VSYVGAVAVNTNGALLWVLTSCGLVKCIYCDDEALGLTKNLTKINIRNMSWGIKAAGA